MTYSAEHGPESGRPQDFNDVPPGVPIFWTGGTPGVVHVAGSSCTGDPCVVCGYTEVAELDYLFQPDWDWTVDDE